MHGYGEGVSGVSLDTHLINNGYVPSNSDINELIKMLA